jgi:pyruvate dehydrogenase E2 component (dihydrolipoamide acetyltransferase)
MTTAGNPGDVVAVGTVLATIATSEEVDKTAPPAKAAPKEAVPKAAPAEAPEKCAVPAAPATRRLAREMGINICAITPSGAGGRVTPEDVQSFASGTAAPPAEKEAPARIPSEEAHREERLAEAEYAAHAAAAIPFLDIEPLPDFTKWGPVETEKLMSIRRRIAHKMVTSMTLIPHVVHMDEADVTLLEEFRHHERERRKGQPGGNLNLLPFIVKAVTAGLRAAPVFNASLDPFKEEIIYKKYYNIGIAVDTDKGLMVPVVKNAESKSIMELSREIEDLAARARDGKIELSDLQGGTFSITNVGPIGGTVMVAAINYPEVAILGMGRATPKPVVRDGQIVIRTMLPLTLSFDHRIADGADAARFVTEMVRELSDPNLLLLEA